MVRAEGGRAVSYALRLMLAIQSCEREGFTGLAAALAELLKRELSTRKSQ